MNETLYTFVKKIVTNSETVLSIQTQAKEVKGLNEKDHNVLLNLVDTIEGFKEDRSLVVDIIKYLVVVVETIVGRKQGELKKQEAYDMFVRILNILELSQRDRKLYTSIFSGTVELIFWGKEFFKTNNFKFLCCK